MSTQSEEDQTKTGGFTVVFRLKRKGWDRLAEGRGAAHELIASKRAEAVVKGRSPLSSDPILSGLYVVPSGDMSATQDVLERLSDDKAVENAYVAPPRDVLASRGVSASRGGISDCYGHCCPYDRV
jgi:hypothetical protein